MSDRDVALDYYRKLVSFVYREVGAMKPDNHRQLYAKSTMVKTGFANQRKIKAKKLYDQSLRETAPDKIESLYYDETGLHLEDVHRIFAEGD